MYVCVPHACLMHTEAGRGDRFPENGVTGSCEPPPGLGDLDTSLLEEQSVLLTVEPSPASVAVVTLTFSSKTIIIIWCWERMEGSH